MDDAKVSQYTYGKVRKSRREKEQEAAEVKKREEEANAAQAYAEFLDAFEGEEVTRKKTGSMFVKSAADGARIAYNPSKALDKPSRALERVCRFITLYNPMHSCFMLVALSSSGAKAKGEACDGCIFGGNQEVWLCLICFSKLFIGCQGIKQNARLASLVRVNKGILQILYRLLNISKAHGQGKSVTAMAGQYVVK